MSLKALSGACRRCQAVGMSARGLNSPAQGIQTLADAFGPDPISMDANFAAWDLYGDGMLDHGQILRNLRRDLPGVDPHELRLIIGELDELLEVDENGKLNLEAIVIACQTLYGA